MARETDLMDLTITVGHRDEPGGQTVVQRRGLGLLRAAAAIDAHVRVCLAGALAPMPLALDVRGWACTEDMGGWPCGHPAVGLRLDPEDGQPYEVCAKHLRPPFPHNDEQEG